MLSKVQNKLKQKSIWLVSPLFRILENINFSQVESEFNQPIFIIGAPRTGSTILYQALTNYFEVAYIDNLVCTWHRNLRFGLWLSHKKYGNQPHNNFKAEYGNTQEFGGHAPSECGQFWYRWLPIDRHFVDHHEVTEKMVAEIRAEVLSATKYLKYPLLFKNLNSGQRLRLINRAFPNAKFIFVRRDPRFVIRSILNARLKVGVKQGKWWGIMPPNFKELLSLPESEMCTAQVFYLENQIEQDLSLFPRENIYEIHYQNFSENLIKELGLWMGVDEKQSSDLPVFKKDDLDGLPKSEKRELDKLVKKYPFKKELFV